MKVSSHHTAKTMLTMGKEQKKDGDYSRKAVLQMDKDWWDACHFRKIRDSQYWESMSAEAMSTGENGPNQRVPGHHRCGRLPLKSFLLFTLSSFLSTFHVLLSSSLFCTPLPSLLLQSAFYSSSSFSFMWTLRAYNVKKKKNVLKVKVEFCGFQAEQIFPVAVAIFFWWKSAKPRVF